jgi:hypothetical protein
VKLQHRQDQQKILYDKSSKSLPTLPARSPVRFFDHGSKVWQPGTIQGVASTPRSYVVETERGSFLRRNRKHFIQLVKVLAVIVKSSSVITFRLKFALQVRIYKLMMQRIKCQPVKIPQFKVQ